MNVQQYFRVPKNVVPPGPDPDAFILTFTLGASDSITLPLIVSGTYNFTVEWGDGTSDVITAWNQAERIHAYTGLPAGDYVVTITGVLTRWDFFTVSTSRLKIKNIIQWGDISATNYDQAFRGCTNLNSIPGGLTGAITTVRLMFLGCAITSIPVDLFTGITVTVDISGTFRQTSITTIPEDLFNGLSISTLTECFFGVPITSIPDELFRFCTVGVFGACFQSCTSLTSIPIDLFRYNTAATNFVSCFQSCTSLTSIPIDLFRYNTAVTTFAGVFALCAGITSIPTDLFRYNTAVTSFSTSFNGCTGITSIPTDVFRYNVNASNFSTCFGSCGITAVPKIFQYNPTKPTNIDFLFRDCPSLATIDADLFDGLTGIAGNGRVVFLNCVSLTSIPSGLFDGLVNSTSMTQMFQGCTGLVTIPTNLFNTNTKVTTYASAFLGCSSLNISVSSLVSGMSMTFVTTTNQMFSGCAALTGLGQDLIDKPKSGSYTVGTGSGTGSYRTFFNCTALTDYATISANYK